jgi:hypothetical protein
MGLVLCLRKNGQRISGVTGLGSARIKRSAPEAETKERKGTLFFHISGTSRIALFRRTGNRIYGRQILHM